MLDAGMQTQLKSYLENVREPIELVPSPDDSPKSREMTELLGEIVHGLGFDLENVES